MIIFDINYFTPVDATLPLNLPLNLLFNNTPLKVITRSMLMIAKLIKIFQYLQNGEAKSYHGTAH